MEKKHLIVQGLDVIYTDCGTGPLLLFLHGWGADASSFATLINHFTENRCIALSFPGFGGSESPKTVWNISDYVRFICDFNAKLNINPDIIIAHSFGGRVAIKGIGTEIFHPRRLILIASAGMAKKSLKTYLIIFFAKIVKAITVVPPFSFLRKRLKRIVESKDYSNAGEMKETFIKIVNETLEKYAKKITTPTLLLWGEKDTETPTSEANLLHRCIRESQLEIIPNKGHFVFQEEPALVAEKIKNFLR